MEGRSKRYKKIDFLGEGQVKTILPEAHLSVQQLYILKEIIFWQFATVYKAEDLETHAIVAVKKVSLSFNNIFRWPTTVYGGH